jgi:hypothetical protein
METKCLVQKFRTILLNEFYENRGRLLDNMKKSKIENSCNQYKDIFVKNVFDYILDFQFKNETKIKKQNRIQSKILRDIEKDKTMKNVFGDFLDAVNEILVPFKDKNKDDLSLGDFHKIEGKVAKTNFVTEYLNDEDRNAFVKNFVACIYTAAKMEKEYVRPLFRMNFAYETYAKSLHRCNAKKLNNLVKQYDSWLNDDMNDDNVNFEFAKLTNSLFNRNEKDQKIFSYLVPLFRLNR